MISLSKDSTSVNLRKGAAIRARVFWPATTDYDLGAEVLYTDGHSESVATFGAGKSLTGAYKTPKQLTTRDGKVRHLGDVQRLAGGATGEEILEIELTDDILAIVPWAYSAQSNGTGSFKRYRVSMEVTCGSDTVMIEAKNASDNDRIYTCVPGMITNLPNEGPKVVYLEKYSAPNSEHRPAVVWEKAGILRKGGIEIAPNGGHKNEYK